MLTFPSSLSFSSEKARIIDRFESFSEIWTAKFDLQTLANFGNLREELIEQKS